MYSTLWVTSGRFWDHHGWIASEPTPTDATEPSKFTHPGRSCSDCLAGVAREKPRWDALGIVHGRDLRIHEAVVRLAPVAHLGRRSLGLGRSHSIVVASPPGPPNSAGPLAHTSSIPLPSVVSSPNPRSSATCHARMKDTLLHTTHHVTRYLRIYYISQDGTSRPITSF